MARGGLCLIDEIGKLRPRTLAMLAPVADHRRTLHSALAGFSLTAHRDFRLLATSNSTDFTTAALPEFITERLSVRIHLDMPDRPALDRILRERFCRAHENTDTFLSLFWELWPQRFERLPSPRQLIQTCQFACNLAASTGRAEVTRADVQEAVDAIHP
jgi:MoxR-like ATPase